ncbi:CRISPR-associated endonuclease Cas2 [uncultured Ilyobacter sp.]|uniref:CRISPR-associated endonuclease Cas2 n=1 Tax=uncultured Ilyobacter sp. TaxID=544433 RepID=UPI0029C9AB54|nr:CRISPR-associated endonuclease Cas2 [uncultured Ilyobacter sp.]
MIITVMYDISENKIRKNVVETLEEFGFYRLQKSVFIGNIDKELRKSLSVYMSRFLKREDKIYIIPLTKWCMSHILTAGNDVRPIFSVIRKNQFTV